jgi:hypothetical protein
MKRARKPQPVTDREVNSAILHMLRVIRNPRTFIAREDKRARELGQRIRKRTEELIRRAIG